MDTMELGGNISLSGFSNLDFTELIVVKKMVGQYARRLSDSTPAFTRLTIHRKEVHGTSKIEVMVKAEVESKEYVSESVGHNLFVVLDECLKHVQTQVQKHLETAQ